MKKNLLLWYIFDIGLFFGLAIMQIVSLLAPLYNSRFQVWFFILLVLICGLSGLFMNYVIKDIVFANKEA